MESVLGITVWGIGWLLAYNIGRHLGYVVGVCARMLRTYLVLGVGELEVMVLVLLLMDQSGSSTRGPEEAVACANSTGSR
jgi:hypothetical protein